MSIERKLPEELLANIISSTSPDTLPDLCRTSKTLNRLTTPYLYSDVTLGEEDFADSLALTPFACTIFTAPGIAPLVNSVVVNEWYGWREEEIQADATSEEAEWPKFGNEEAEKVLKRICAKQTISEAGTEELYKKVRYDKNMGAILVLLLASLPNVKRMEFSFGEAAGYSDFVSMLELVTARFRSVDHSPINATGYLASKDLSSSPSATFTTPVDVIVKGTSDKYPSNPDVLAAFFNLPNLRAIYAWRIGDSEMAEHKEGNACSRLKPKSCPVECIEVRFSKLHTDDLKFLLNAAVPGKLKTFNYEIGNCWAWVTLDQPEIIRSLEPHYETLECLGLSHELGFYPYEIESPDDKPFPVSFTPFKALTHLKVAPVFIWGDKGLMEITAAMIPEKREMLWKALPGSLEELWLAQADHSTSSKDGIAFKFVPDCLLPALEFVVQMKLQAFPKLQHLRIEFELRSWKSDWFDALVCLIKAAGAKGIHSTIIVNEWPDIVDDDNDGERRWGWNEDVQWGYCEQNQGEWRKWIVAAEEPDLGQVLRDAKAKLHSRM
jgi:hypothetical protein